MRSNGYQLSPSTDVLVQFVLEIYEGSIGAWGEPDIAQDRSSKERTNFSCLGTISNQVRSGM